MKPEELTGEMGGSKNCEDLAAETTSQAVQLSAHDAVVDVRHMFHGIV